MQPAAVQTPKPASWVKTHVAADGLRNASVLVTGAFCKDETLTVLDVTKDFAHLPKGVKIENLVWLIQEKATFHLLWGDEFILPMESRNYVRFERGLECPREGWDGTIRVRCLNCHKGNDYLPKHFTIILDLDKL